MGNIVILCPVSLFPGVLKSCEKNYKIHKRKFEFIVVHDKDFDRSLVIFSKAMKAKVDVVTIKKKINSPKYCTLPSVMKRFQLFCKLQDSGWEFEKEGDSARGLIKHAIKMRDGPLGRSCMYQIVNDKSKVVWNG